MKMLSRFFPYIFIFLVWFIFSSPYFIFGKAPFASDYQMNFFAPWSAYEEFAGPVKNNAMPDVIGQIYPWKTFSIETLKAGFLPIWNPYSFSGTPHIANYQSAVFSPINSLFFLMPFKDAWSLMVLLQPLLAGFFMLLFLKSHKLSDLSSLVGAVSFMFCGFITTWMGYGTLGFSILFLPLALFLIEKYILQKRKIYLLLFALTFPLSFFSGHFQISLYFLIFVFAYLVFKLLTVEKRKEVFELFIFMVLGMLLSSLQIYPSIIAYTMSFRSEIFQKAEIIPWAYLPTLIAPDIFGNPVTRNDWFGHYAEWNGYIGIVPLILSFYSLIGRVNKLRIFFLVMAVLSILLSFQSPILDLLVTLKIPVLSTSAASRIIVLLSFSLIVLSAFGLDDLVRDLKNKRLRPIIFLLLFFGLTLSTLWGVVVTRSFLSEDKLSIFRQNLILPSVLFGAFSLITLSHFFSKRIGEERFAKIFMILVLLIVSFDMLRFANKWQSFQSKDLIFKDLPITNQLKKLPNIDRSFGNFGAEVGVTYRLPLVEGYDAVYLKRYGEFIASIDDGKLKQSGRSVVSFPRASKNATKAADLMGVKYIIHRISDGQADWTFPVWKNPNDYKSIFRDERYEIFENKRVYPRAFIVGDYKVARNDQEIIDLLLSEDLRKTVILEEDPKITLSGNGNSNAHILSYKPNEVVIETTSDKDGFLFLSDSYHPGWIAKVDDKPAKIYRTDYTFRSVYVPKGEHTVKFEYYISRGLRMGATLFIIGLVGIIVYLLSSQNLSSRSSNRFLAKKKR